MQKPNRLQLCLALLIVSNVAQWIYVSTKKETAPVVYQYEQMGKTALTERPYACPITVGTDIATSANWQEPEKEQLPTGVRFEWKVSK